MRKKTTSKKRGTLQPAVILPDYLEGLTGRNSAWWFARVQKAIIDNSRPSADPKHDVSDADAWLRELCSEVTSSLPSQGVYDGNMRSAVVLSYVLALWYFRLHRAKCFDPNRPLDQRRGAYLSWLTNVRAFTALPVDERDDFTYLPQKWDNPWLPGAKSGKFV